MRVGVVRVGLAGVFLAVVGSYACIPDPGGDFDDYQGRVAALPKGPDIGSFDGSAAPTETVEALYYGACMSELAFNDPNQVFNFYTQTKFTPNASGGTLELTIAPLATNGRAPPPTISKAGIVSDVVVSPPTAVDQEGRYKSELGIVAFPGTANPITQSDVKLVKVALQGRFGTNVFCARLVGHIEQPKAVERDLDIEKNVCRFVPIKDGDPTPTLTPDQFAAGSCPI